MIVWRSLWRILRSDSTQGEKVLWLISDIHTSARIRYIHVPSVCHLWSGANPEFIRNMMKAVLRADWPWVLFWPSCFAFLRSLLLPRAPVWVSCPLTLVLPWLSLQYQTLDQLHTDCHLSGSWMAWPIAVWPDPHPLSWVGTFFYPCSSPPSVAGLDHFGSALGCTQFCCTLRNTNLSPFFHLKTLLPVQASYFAQIPSPGCLISLPNLFKKGIPSGGTRTNKGIEVRMWKTWLGSIGRPVWLN